MQVQQSPAPLIGIGSFAYRYAIGFQDCTPPNPMTVFDFLTAAHRLGLKRVQLCENLAYASFSHKQFQAIRTLAEQLGISIELGMRDITKDNLEKHLEIADLLSSHFLRVVLGKNGLYKEKQPETLTQQAIEVFHDAIPTLKSLDVTIGIENHFDVTTEYLVNVVEEVNDRHAGLIFDTTNCLGFIRTPEETLKMLGPHLVSVHLKDYFAHKVEAGYLIRGTVLGEGWLDLEGILRSVLAYNPKASLILEMTIRCEPEQRIDDIILWEKQAIEQSVSNLHSMLQRIKREEVML